MIKSKHIARACLAMLFFLSYSFLFAQDDQERTIQGTVIDSVNGGPLPGATVSVKGRPSNVMSNAEGFFKIKVTPEDKALVFSYIGYQRREIPITSASEVTVAMISANDSALNDVIVVGYGTQKRVSLTGAVATVDADDIADLPVANVAAALRGRVAGLGVNFASGRPGASITLNVRGAQSSSSVGGTSSEPLYVIDNMIVGKSTFDNLDPSMIESITILKDATAAIYGAAGAKGVVQITTKKGHIGAPRLSYSGFAGYSDAVRKPEMLSAYEHAKLLNDTYKINGTSEEDFFSDEDLEYLKTHQEKSWFDEVWQPALTQRHSLNLSGGSDKVTYFVGGSYSNQNANYAGQKYDKKSFRGGMSAKLMSNVKMDVNFNIDNNSRFSKNGWSENDQQFIETLIRVPRWTPIKVGDHYVNYEGGSKRNFNPFALINSGMYNKNISRSYGLNVSLSYAPKSGPLKGLTLRVQGSTTASNGKNEEFRPEYLQYNLARWGNNELFYRDSIVGDPIVNNEGDNARLIQGQNESNNYRVFATASYARTIGDHDFSVMVGGEQSEGWGSGMGYYYINQQIPDQPYFWAFDPVPTVNTPSASQSAKRSFFGNFRYTYAGKYIIDGTARLDASANFAVNNVWGFFPRLGLGWVVSQEKFFKEHAPWWLNYLKLRANLGLTGDDRVGGSFWRERYTVNVSSYLYNELNVAGLRPDVYPNPDITWERNRTFNFGADLSLFENHLDLGYDVFLTKNYDVFDKGNDQNFPMYAGFKAPVVNNIIRYSWGMEFSLSYNTNLAQDLKLKASTNFAFGNYVTHQKFFNRFELWQDPFTEDWAENDFGLDPRIYNTGNYGLINEGMFHTQKDVDEFMNEHPNYTQFEKIPEPGWLKFKDVDGDGKITDRDLAPMFKNGIDPALVTGLQIGLTYKSLDWRVNIGAEIGGKKFYDSKAMRSDATPELNVPSFYNDTWTVENTDASFPRYDDPSIGILSDFWAVDGTTIRVNDMQLSYTVPRDFVKKFGLNSARVVAAANNLWVIKNPFSFKDPESSYIYDYPAIRTISIGLNLGL